MPAVLAVLAYGLVYTTDACFCSVIVPSLTPAGFMHMTIGCWPAGPAAAQRLADACTEAGSRLYALIHIVWIARITSPRWPFLFTCSSAYKVQLRNTGCAGVSLPNLTLLVIVHF